MTVDTLTKKNVATEKISYGTSGDSKSNSVGYVNADSVKTYLNEIGRTDLLNAQQEIDYAKSIEAGLYATHLLQNSTDLARSEKRDLKIIERQGAEAQQKLLKANLRLVVSLAKRYTGRGMPLLDLIQEGNLGLIRAVEKYDYSLGYKFSTYATWWIKQSISRGIADQAKTIRIPVHLIELINKLTKLKREIYQDLGREATTAELAERSGVSEQKITSLLNSSKDPMSLDMQIGEEDDAELGDFVANTTAVEAEDTVYNHLLSDELSTILDKFDKREREILEMRFGIGTGEPKTLDQIGKYFNLSRERVRQIEQNAIAKLRKNSKTSNLKVYLSD